MNSSPLSLTITKPDDWHLHLRDGEMLSAVLPYTATVFARALVMPNLNPPITTVEMALSYFERIMERIKNDSIEANSENDRTTAFRSFRPFMSLYLTNEMSPNEISKIKNHSDCILGCKLYPQGATTNSAHGVKNIKDIYSLLETMQKENIPLMIHGEDISPEVDIFDREKVFIEDTLSQLVKDFPELRITLEHITTKDAVDFVKKSSDFLKASITPHHLLLNRNDLLVGGIKPHYYCLPIVKLEQDRLSLVQAATSGNASFFLGTDSAPHLISDKESSCGCAGIFCAPVTLPLCADIFEKENKLENLEAFCSLNGARHYQKDINKEKITLYRKSYQPPVKVAIKSNNLANQNSLETVNVFLGGETLNWKL